MSDRLLSLAAVAERHGVCTRTLRRRLAARDGSAPLPCRVKPFKFRASDVDAHLRRLTVTDQLQADARRHP